MNERRQNGYKCPKCGYKLLAISGEYVVCLNPDPNCGWKEIAKRNSDGKIPLLSTLKENWQ